MISVSVAISKLIARLSVGLKNLLAPPLDQFLLRRANRWLWVGLGVAILSGILLPLNLLTIQRFHHDEALYATWALQIASGTNPWLARVPVDKPPLFLYTVAGTMRLLGQTETIARLPSLIATGFTIGLTFRLGQILYGSGVGLLAAWFVALSPFTILFAPTVLTDPMLITFVMAGCLAAVQGRAGWAGFWLGLALVTKQQGIFFVPLALGLLYVQRSTAASSGMAGREADWSNHAPGTTHHASHVRIYAGRFGPYIRLLLTTAVTVFPTLLWDMSRSQLPGFWQMSLINYGGLSAVTADVGERWWELVTLLRYATASPTLDLIFIAGLPILLVSGLWQCIHSHSPKARPNLGSRDFPTRPLSYSVSPSPDPLDKRFLVFRFPRGTSVLLSATGHDVGQISSRVSADWLFSLFALAFIFGHVWLSFQVWDRYFLGLIPILALLMARIIWLPWRFLRQIWFDRQSHGRPVAGLMTGLVMTFLLGVSMAQPVQGAVNARYPLGSNSAALSGIEQVAAYLQGHVGANNTLYHRWLGTHWRFYLWDYPYDLQYWSSPTALARKAKVGHLIAFPSWQSETEVRLALAGTGLTLHELTRAYAPAGYPSLILYRIEALNRGGLARKK